MRPEAIFGPVSVLALWTGGVLFLTGVRRILAIRKRRLPRDAFRLGETPDVPPEISVCNRNLMNLLEMPLLFYVAIISLYVTRHVDAAVIWLAWVYVGLRIVHSILHLTSNVVIQRFVPFALSNLVLLAIWISFINRLL